MYFCSGQPTHFCSAVDTVRFGGWLKVAEPTTRWRERNLEELLGAITSSGFSVVGQPSYRDRFIYVDAIKS